jgi:predicted enzyme related to lactoylglutathione lyase
MENTKGPTLGNGKICYVEIPANNIKESSAFYHTVFGWKIRTRGDGAIAFDDGIGEVSGTWVLGRKPLTKPGLVVSIMVDNVVETVDKIIALDCKIIKQTAISESEIIAWFSDPTGNVIGLYQHPGGGHGKICYVEIPATDIAGASDFYKAVFNWPIRNDNHGNAAFDDSVGVVSGMWTSELKPSESGLLIYIMVDSVGATADAIIANGGRIIQPPKGNSKEDTAVFSDPAGNILGIGQE